MNTSRRLQQLAALKRILRALRARNYRLFFVGQGISLVGTWMTRVATSWLVYRLTGSALWLGVVGFVSQAPTFLLAPIAGVLADRWHRHRILVVTQALSMAQSFAMGALALSGRITMGEVIALSTLQGLVNAFDIPARQSFVLEMVERKEDLGNAIALNSSIFNGARLLGPSIAGLVISAAGEGVCFLLDGISYVAVLAALLAMRLTRRPARSGHAPIVQGLREGLAYAMHSPPIRAILVLVGWSSLTGMSYTVLMPVMAKEILHGGPHTLGFLMAASGLGALSGAVALAARVNVVGLERVIAPAGAAFGLGLMGFALSRAPWLSTGLLVIVGYGMIVQMASSNTMLQTIAEDDKRGRIMSLYATAFMGMATFGSLLAGSFAHWLGAPATIAIGGASSVLASAIFARSLAAAGPLAKPTQRPRSVMRDMATGVQAAAILSTAEGE